MGTQESIFLKSEGDQWYLRNRTKIENANSFWDVDFISERLTSFRSEINRILEVGCADGNKVEKLAQKLEAEPFGIDPSEKAVSAATKRTKKPKNFLVGTANEINFANSDFDVVFVAFCLYLVSRDELQNAINEIDRVLRPGGFLVIEDFDPGLEIGLEYSHDRRITTFKSDYSKNFLNYGKYYLCDKLSISHENKYFSHEINERISVQIMHKKR